MQRLPRLVELILALILCAVIALWAVRMTRGDAIAVPPAATAAATSGSGRVDEVIASARLFGSRRPGVLSDNVRALGIVADASGQGSVIVSVDGQAPRVYRVGDTLDGRRVTAIHAGEIELEANGARQVFRLPPSRPAAQGLTIIGSGPATSSMPVVSQPVSPYAAPPSPPPAMQAQPRLGYPPPMPTQSATPSPGPALNK